MLTTDLVTDLATGLRRFTVDELRAMAETGVIASDARVELIDGLIVDMSPIGKDHAFYVERAFRLYLRRWPDDASDVPYVRVQQPIELGPRYQLVPDVAVVLGSNDRYRDHIPQPGEILEVVEVADSSLAIDTRAKLDAYQQAEVPTIVVIDINGRQVHRWARSASGYVHAPLAGTEEWFPGSTVDQLFA
jgi:Uma2 family endonuclease